MAVVPLCEGWQLLRHGPHVLIKPLVPHESPQEKGGCAILRGPCPSTALWHRGREGSPASAWPPPCCSTTESSSCPAPHGHKHRHHQGQAKPWHTVGGQPYCHAPCPGPQDKNRWPHHLSGGSPLGVKGKRAISCMSLLVPLASPEAPEVLSQSVMSMVPSTRLGPNSTASSNVPLPKHSQDFWAPQKGPRGTRTQRQRSRWQRSRWTWNISLFMDTSGIHFQTQKCIRTPAESRQEYLTSGKKYTEPRKTQ